jgi:hypothetical protein
MRRTTRRLVVMLAALGMILALVSPAVAHDDKPQLPPLEIPDGHIGLFVSENVEYVTGRQGWTGGHVAFDGDWMYVGSYGLGMRVYDISAGENPDLIGSWLPIEPRADAVPAAATFDGRRIASLNGTRRVTNPPPIRTDRSEFLDFSDPENPVLLHEFVGADDGEAHVGHFVEGQRLWVPAGGSGAYGGDGGLDEEARPEQDHEHHRGLRLYDLSPLLDNDPEDCDAHAGWDNPCAPELLIAVNPVELWEDSPYRNGREVGHDFTHTHDATPFEGVHVEGLGVRDLLLLAEGGNYLDDDGNTGSAFVIDITDPTDPVVLLRFIHPGYDDDREHDPIRYYHEARLLDGDPTVMMITDEDMHSGCDDGGAIYFVQLSADYTEATPLSEWHIPNDFLAPVCSVHNFTTDGNLVYIGSYNAGLQILDASDPANPERVGYFIAEGTTAWGAYYNDGLIYVGDMTRGLDVFRFAPEDDPDATDDDNGDDDDAIAAPSDDGGDLPVTGGQGWLVFAGLLALATAALVRRRLLA